MHPKQPTFPDRPFTVAEAVAAGVSPSRLRRKDLAAPFAGIRTTTVGELPFRELCRAFSLRLPSEGAFSHSTAARLHGFPLPLALLREGVLHVSVPNGRRAPHAAGVAGHETSYSPVDVDSRFGFRATTPERTWCDLASLLTLPDLVAGGDQLLFWERPATSKKELVDAVDRFPGRRGRRNLHRALGLLDGRAESPMESKLRVLIVLAGLPAPDVNESVYDSTGRFVARIDLSYHTLRIAMEHEGDHHRADVKQWRRDIARIRKLQAMGWTVLRYTADDLEDPSTFLVQLRGVLADREVLPRH